MGRLAGAMKRQEPFFHWLGIDKLNSMVAIHGASGTVTDPIRSLDRCEVSEVCGTWDAFR